MSNEELLEDVESIIEDIRDKQDSIYSYIGKIEDLRADIERLCNDALDLTKQRQEEE